MSLRLEDSVNGVQLAKNLQLFFQKWKIPEDKYLNVLGPYASFYFRPENVEIPLDTVRKIAKRIDVKVADLTITDDIYQKRMGLLQRLPGRKSTNKAKKQTNKTLNYGISDERCVVASNIARIFRKRKYTLEEQKEILGLQFFNQYVAVLISGKHKHKKINIELTREIARKLKVDVNYLRTVTDKDILAGKKTVYGVSKYKKLRTRKVRYPGSTQAPLGTGSKAHPVGWNNDRMAMK